MQSIFKHLFALTIIGLSAIHLDAKTTSDQDIGIRAAHILAAQNQSACIPLTVFNFNSVTALSYDMTWNATKLRFDSISGINLAGLDAADFDNFSQAASGMLHLDWQADSGESASLTNEAVVYQVCFTMINLSEAQYGVQLSNGLAQNLSESNPAVKFINGQIGRYSLTAAVSDFAMELEIDYSTILNISQDTCIAVRTVRFVDIVSFQYTMSWDTALLQLDSIHFDATNLPDYGLDNFNQPMPGVLVNVYVNVATLEGVTLSPGTVLYYLCFSSKGTNGLSPIAFENTPTPFEAVSEPAFEAIPFLAHGGFFLIPDQDVWPGDTDHNGEVSHFDLLPIGLAYDATGPQRPGATIDWVAQIAPEWLQSTAAGINYKHIDSDGNGTINADDTLAVVQNWGLEVPPFRPNDPNSEPRILGAPLYIQSDTLEAGQTASLNIILGDSEQIAEAVYGIAFSVTYDPDAIVAGSISASFENSWLGQINSDLIAIHRSQTAANRVDIAITRIDGQNISGDGAIGQLRMTIADDFQNPFTSIEFGIENVRLISNDGTQVLVEPATSISWIEGTTATHDPELANSIRFFPTPASDYISIETEGLQINALQILDQYGRVLKSWKELPQRIPVQDLATGMYLARISTDRGFAYKSFLVTR